MANQIAAFDDWVQRVSPALGGDPLWRMAAYRLATFCLETGWADVTRLAQRPLTEPIGAQLYRALGSVGANLAEGYSRSSGRDRVRMFEYALGSARECIVWYRASTPVLGAQVTGAREAILQRVVQLLLVAIPAERNRVIRTST